MKRQAGFTLLEVMIAMIIIAGSIVVLSNAWSGNFLRMRKAALMQDVSHLIERKMVEIDLKYRNNVASIPDKAGGHFKGYPKYRWQMRSHDFRMPDLTALMFTQKKGENASAGVSQIMMTMVSTMQTYFKQAVKEVTLTVYAKVGKREVPYSVTTYFVDFNKMPNLPGMPTQ